MPFSSLFPLLSIMLWVLAVAIPITITYLHLLNMMNGAPSVTLRSGAFTITVQRSNLLAFAAELPGRPGMSRIATINLPGLVPEILVSRFIHSWPSMWASPGVNYNWRTISYPIYCLPFWWFVGTGADALRKKQHPHWFPAAVSFFLTGFCFTAVFVFTFVFSSTERDELVVPIWGFALWGVLFACLPTAWIAWFLRKNRWRLTQHWPTASEIQDSPFAQSANTFGRARLQPCR